AADVGIDLQLGRAGVLDHGGAVADAVVRLELLFADAVAQLRARGRVRIRCDDQSAGDRRDANSERSHSPNHFASPASRISARAENHVVTTWLRRKSAFRAGDVERLPELTLTRGASS